MYIYIHIRYVYIRKHVDIYIYIYIPWNPIYRWQVIPLLIEWTEWSIKHFPPVPAARIIPLLIIAAWVSSILAWESMISRKEESHWWVVGPPLWKIGLGQLGWWQKPIIWEKKKMATKPPTSFSRKEESHMTYAILVRRYWKIELASQRWRSWPFGISLTWSTQFLESPI